MRHGFPSPARTKPSHGRSPASRHDLASRFRTAQPTMTDDSRRPTIPPPRLETAVIRDLRAGGPLPDHLPHVAPSDVPGMCEVTFAWRAENAEQRRGEMMVHINSITDAHRDDIAAARMPWIDGTDVAALGYLLPDDLAASYRIVGMPRIPDHPVRTAEGWREVHAAGRPDPRNGERIPNPLGNVSSVMRLPRSPRHAAEDLTAAPRRSFRAVDLTLPADVPAPWARLLIPDDRPQRLLILFDGEVWNALPLDAVLARHRGPSTAVAIVGSGPRPNRVSWLPDPVAAPSTVEAVVNACRETEVAHLAVPERAIVAGQSLGGLAAATVAVHRPDLAARAIAQSGSYWHGAPEGTPRTEGGRIFTAVAATPLPDRRLVIQYGRSEPQLGPLGRRFAEACRAASATVIEREYPGGHDYAWWLTGVMDGLDALDAG